MKVFLKKYGVTAFLIIAITLQFLYIDNQQNRYLNIDNKKIDEYVFIALLTLLSALAIFMFIVWAKQGIELKHLVSGLIGIPGACFGLYLFLHPFFSSGVYFINGIFILKQTVRPYKIVFINPESGELTLFDLQTHQAAWYKEPTTDLKHHKRSVKDTVQLVYKSGLLGFRFDPNLN